MRSTVSAAVNVTIEVLDAATGVLQRQQAHNLVTLAGRNRLRDALAGDAVSLAISHVALGTGSTAPVAGNTALGTEVYRDIPTQLVRTDGKLTVKLYLPANQANGYTLAEGGLFVGGTAVPNSGVLFARVTYAGEAKTSAQAWTITWEVTISAA